MHGLEEYRRKRNFRKTAEPKAALKKSQNTGLIFVVQEHQASHLHYDFRLEWEGVLKSWAVPKGPSLDPAVKRLAVQVEDHPYEYARFEGEIPAGEYGAGQVCIWDSGTWEPDGDAAQGLERGHLEFRLKGGRLRGHWLLQRLPRASGGKSQWLLIKRKDEFTMEEKPAPASFHRPVTRRKRSPPAPKKAIVQEIELSNPDRVIYRREGITKQDVFRYYRQVRRWLLPHAARRPLAILRCPSGAGEACFYQKHLQSEAPPAIHPLRISEKQGPRDYISIDSLDGLKALVQLGGVEWHAWNCVAGSIEHPDQIVMDLDPGPGVRWSQVVRTALKMRDLLREKGLRSFVKVSGGKGLHVCVPFKANRDWETVQSFARSLAREMAAREPRRWTATLAKSAREKKIFIDYLRNSRGAMTVLPYSLRAGTVSSVAMPVAWEQLSELKSARGFTLQKALEHLKKRRTDPWADYFKVKQELPVVVEVKRRKKKESPA